MTPVFQNPLSQDGTYYGYGIQDFLTIDPRWGTDEELQALIEEAHGIFWRGADGRPNPNWKIAPQNMMNDPALTVEAAVFPDELRANQFFRRQGSKLEGTEGDFYSLKEFKTEVSEITTHDGFYHPVQDTRIKVYQYAIAKFDIDGLRIDTLKYVERSFARIFGLVKKLLHVWGSF